MNHTQTERDLFGEHPYKEMLAYVGRRVFTTEGAIVTVGPENVRFDNWPSIEDLVAPPVDPDKGQVPTVWVVSGRIDGAPAAFDFPIDWGGVTIVARVQRPPIVALLTDAAGGFEVVSVPVALFSAQHTITRGGVRKVTFAVPGLLDELVALPGVRGRAVAWRWRIHAALPQDDIADFQLDPLRMTDEITARVGTVDVQLALREWMHLTRGVPRWGRPPRAKVAA